MRDESRSFEISVEGKYNPFVFDNKMINDPLNAVKKAR